MAGSDREFTLSETKQTIHRHNTQAVFLLAGCCVTQLESLREHRYMLFFKPVAQAVDGEDEQRWLVVLSLPVNSADGGLALARQAAEIWQLEHARKDSYNGSDFRCFGLLVDISLMAETCRRMSLAGGKPQLFNRLTKHRWRLIVELKRLGQVTRWLVAEAAGVDLTAPDDTDLNSCEMSEAQWYAADFPGASLEKLMGSINALWLQRDTAAEYLVVVCVKLEVAAIQMNSKRQQQLRDYDRLLAAIDTDIRMHCNRRINTQSCYAGAGEFFLSLPGIDADDAVNLAEMLGKRIRRSTRQAVSPVAFGDFQLTIGSASGRPSEAMPMWMLSQLADLDRLDEYL